MNDSNDVAPPPPGLSKDHFATVGRLRPLIEQSERYGRLIDIDVDDVSALLAAYEAVSARLAWLAAEHAGCLNS